MEDFLIEEAARVTVPLENRRIELRAWRYTVKGVRGFEVPVYFLDADLPSNAEGDRALTGSLYGGDAYYRLCQEVLLGIGGVRILRALGYTDLTRYHMNEGHAALLSLELLGEEAEKAGRTSIRGEDIEKVRRKCVFTTHPPVPAGHDRFPMEYVTRVFPDQNAFFDLKDSTSADLMKRVLQAERDFPDIQEAARAGASLNMTYLALRASAPTSMASPSCTEKLRARCFRRYTSRPSPTESTRAPGPVQRSRSFLIAASLTGARITIVCAAP